MRSTLPKLPPRHLHPFLWVQCTTLTSTPLPPQHSHPTTTPRAIYHGRLDRPQHTTYPCHYHLSQQGEARRPRFIVTPQSIISILSLPTSYHVTPHHTHPHALQPPPPVEEPATLSHHKPPATTTLASQAQSASAIRSPPHPYCCPMHDCCTYAMVHTLLLMKGESNITE